jgi:gamma-glutamylcyclotransferase
VSCLVFAYGSNMCRERMLHRVASAVPVNVGKLKGYQLAIHKRGIDGSGKANTIYTGKPDHGTWGVVYRIAKEHKPLLDEIEFVGVGYDTVEVNLGLSAGGSVRAWTYLARSAAIQDGLKPYAWYKAFMVRGARQHQLPAEYVGLLEAIEATPDLDAARHQRNLSIIEV